MVNLCVLFCLVFGCFRQKCLVRNMIINKHTINQTNKQACCSATLTPPLMQFLMEVFIIQHTGETERCEKAEASAGPVEKCQRQTSAEFLCLSLLRVRTLLPAEPWGWWWPQGCTQRSERFVTRWLPQTQRGPPCSRSWTSSESNCPRSAHLSCCLAV